MEDGDVGSIAQRLEQGTHNPLVPGSNPGGPKVSGKMKIKMKGWAKVDPRIKGWSRVVNRELWLQRFFGGGTSGNGVR